MGPWKSFGPTSHFRQRQLPLLSASFQSTRGSLWGRRLQNFYKQPFLMLSLWIYFPHIIKISYVPTFIICFLFFFSFVTSVKNMAPLYFCIMQLNAVSVSCLSPCLLKAPSGEASINAYLLCLFFLHSNLVRGSLFTCIGHLSHLLSFLCIGVEPPTFCVVFEGHPALLSCRDAMLQSCYGCCQTDPSTCWDLLSWSLLHCCSSWSFFSES